MDSRLASFALWAVCVGCGPAVESDEPVTTMGMSTGGGAAATSTGASSTSPPNDPGSSGEVETSTSSGDAPMASSGGLTTSETGSDSSSGVPFDADCEGRCANLVDGSCIGQLESCVSTCETAVGDQGDAVAEAFESCISTQPLCFSFLEDCMWAALYEGVVEQSYALEGAGFEAWNGRTVHTLLFETGAESSATITDGQFTVETTVTASFDPYYNPRTFYYYVDTDDDGICTDADYVYPAALNTLGTDFDAPTFVVQTTPQNPSTPHLCGEL